jgi:hypothetical protein
MGTNLTNGATGAPNGGGRVNGHADRFEAYDFTDGHAAGKTYGERIAVELAARAADGAAGPKPATRRTPHARPRPAAPAGPLFVSFQHGGLIVTFTVVRQAEAGPPAPDATPGAATCDAEQNILEAFAECQPVTARQLAERAGYRLNSHFRGILARMRRAGLLRHDDNGYTAAPRPEGGS